MGRNSKGRKNHSGSEDDTDDGFERRSKYSEYSDGDERKKEKKYKDREKSGDRSKGKGNKGKRHSAERSTGSPHASGPGGGYGGIVGGEYAPAVSSTAAGFYQPYVPPETQRGDYGHYQQPQEGYPPFTHPPPQQYTVAGDYSSAGYAATPPPAATAHSPYVGGYTPPPPVQYGQQTQDYNTPPPLNAPYAGYQTQPAYGYTPSPAPAAPYEHMHQYYPHPPAAEESYRASQGNYPPPARVPSAFQEAHGLYHPSKVSEQDSSLYTEYPTPEYAKPKKYVRKYHSTAQESTLAQLKPEAQTTQAHGTTVGPASTAPTPSVGSCGGGILGFLQKRKSNKPQDILGSFAGSLLPSLHDYARTLFPPSTTHSNPYYPNSTATPGNPDLETGHRYNSFAPMRTSMRHHPKWYVDGKDYMWAVSCALENAKHTIWIMDWWLSPELHLRRPASRWTFPGDPPGGRYRLDNMLAAAAARGVEIKIVVYKEVEAALTLNSHYTKRALEARHPNIAVMRHPDHVPDATNTVTDIYAQVKDGYRFGDFMRGLYGMKDGKVLFWAHHEKMVLVDAGWGEGQEKGFMGGLDLCFGRWDTNEHPIADMREDIEGEIFLGQDYNNARVMDFHTVDNWTQNKLDRATSSRMGWSDVAFSLQGPVLKDMAMHFIQRWNFIYDEKYRIRFSGGERYKKLPELSNADDPKMRKKLHGIKEKMKVKYGDYSHAGYGGSPAISGQYGVPQHSEYQYHGAVQSDFSGYDDHGEEGLGDRDGVRCQLLRSASKWSHGTMETEHSICNAYIDIILSAQHFIYIENQFFITATTPKKQSPILNMIGAAIVERIMRAYNARQPFKFIILIPAVPAFAGDLQDEGSLGTRAIMEFQYRSIIRDNQNPGYSIIEQLIAKGIPPDQVKNYISFYNLRNYDRINYTKRVESAEKQSGVAYDQARQDYEKKTTGVGYGPYGSGPGNEAERYRSQQIISRPSVADKDASIASCSMLGGGDVREVPWYGAPEKEIEAFVSEELYIHSKLLIADDRTVICGSANLNDRSQLGDHDSEIAMVIEDPTPLPSMMAGQPYIASHFAGTLRRQLFRKHLGLIPAQDLSDTRDENMQPSPVPNVYDFDSEEDRLVADPLGMEFTRVWEQTARVNTECFRQVFRAVPDDGITNWKMYDEWFGAVFKAPKVSKVEKEKEKEKEKVAAIAAGVKPATPVTGTQEGEKVVATPPPAPKAEEMWGHVVRRNFSKDPVQAAKEVKQVLAHIRGHLVEFPLHFLEEEDIAKEGVSLNAFTETVYT